MRLATGVSNRRENELAGIDEERRDDPVEGGALEDDETGAERPPAHDEPVESGALEDEPADAD